MSFSKHIFSIPKKNRKSIVFTYDFQGRRIKKEISANGQLSTANYIYDGNQIILETDSNNVTQARYIYGSGLDEPIIMIREGNTYFYHYDGLGSVVSITDSSGNLVESYSYDIFGTPDNTSSIGNPYYFTGRQLDPETGLYYYRARYYSPLLGRFITPDPVGYKDGLNLYTYCLNNPTIYVDPYGFEAGGWTQKIKEVFKWLWEELAKNKSVTVTFDAGTGKWGVSGEISIDGSGITGRVGGGWGIGRGVSISGGSSIGESSGFGITGSVSGGTGFAGGSASATFSQGGTEVSGSLGSGAGLGVTVTGGYSGDVISW